MASATFLVPGPLTAVSGGSIYDRRMVDGLRTRGWQVVVHELDASFPEPTVEALRHAAQVLATIPDGTVVMCDGLACGAMPAILEPHATRLHFVALVHMPLATEIGLDAQAAVLRQGAEVRALNLACAVVVTGRGTIDTLSAMGYRSSEPYLVEPGCDLAPVSEGSRGRTPHLLCVAALTPGKGHEALLLALEATRADWTLTCVGSLTRDSSTAAKVARLVESLSLKDRVVLRGELKPEDLAAEYARADVFVLNTRRETYGMAVAEAVARGLPVVGTRTGAIPEIVGSDGGILVDAGDSTALQAALRKILTDGDVRARCRAGAIRARDRLQPWHCAVRRLADILETIPGHA